jgi:hypothetical protein
LPGIAFETIRLQWGVADDGRADSTVVYRTISVTEESKS